MGLSINAFGQSMQSILQPTDTTYHQICARMETYFATNGCDESDEDGLYAKFVRWSHFWRNRTDSQGRFNHVGAAYAQALLQDLRIGSQTSEKEALLGELLKKYSTERDYANLESLLNAENTTYALRVLLHAKMEQGQFDLAQSLLDNLPSDTPDEQDYKTVQQLNLQRLSEPNFALSQSQYQTLRGIADAYGSQAPTAQAILGILRGEYFDWPETEAEEGEGKTARVPYPQVPLIDLKTGTHLHLSPNPTAQSTLVQVPPFVWEGKAQIEVLDMAGRVVQSISLQPEQTEVTINAQTLHAGIYLVTLRDNGVLLAQSKLAVQH